MRAKLIGFKDVSLKHHSLMCGERAEIHLEGLIPWGVVYSRWGLLTHSFCRDFPYLDPYAIGRFKGGDQAFVTYLAETQT